MLFGVYRFLECAYKAFKRSRVNCCGRDLESVYRRSFDIGIGIFGQITISWWKSSVNYSKKNFTHRSFQQNLKAEYEISDRNKFRKIDNNCKWRHLINRKTSCLCTNSFGCSIYQLRNLYLNWIHKWLVICRYYFCILDTRNDSSALFNKAN